MKKLALLSTCCITMLLFSMINCAAAEFEVTNDTYVPFEITAIKESGNSVVRYVPAGTTVMLGHIGAKNQDNIKYIAAISFQEGWVQYIKRLMMRGSLPELTQEMMLKLQKVMEIIKTATVNKPSIYSYRLKVLEDPEHKVTFDVKTAGEWVVL